MWKKFAALAPGFSFLLPLLPGCTQPQKAAAPARQLQQIQDDSAFADAYYVADLNCQGGTNVAAIDASSINLWQGTSTREVSYKFSGVSTQSSLTGPGIMASYYGFHQTSACSGQVGDGACKEPQVVTEQQPLRICNAQTTYPRISAEGVALTSLANLEVAHTYYMSIPNHKADMLAASLLVLPTIEKDYGTAHTVSTDNLAYAPDFGGAPVFVVYPKGERAVQLGLWDNLNLWELPWGLAHEFGHHVFRTHTGVATVGDASTGLDAASPIHSFRADRGRSGSPLAGNMVEPLALAGRTVGDVEVWGAVNEGYADLFAYYIYGSKPGLVDHVDCFQGNREVSQASFADGHLKALSAEVLSVFNASDSVQTASCTSPNFQDIHAIGAIIAHGVDSVYSATVGAATGSDAALKKVQLQLAWAERLGNLQRQNAANKTSLTFAAMVKEALYAAAADGKLSAAACAAAKTSFPEFYDDWKAQGIGCP